MPFFKESREKHKGWGHSFAEDVCEFADQRAVQHLALFHHHPRRRLSDYKDLETLVQQRLKTAKHLKTIDVTYDNFEIQL